MTGEQSLGTALVQRHLVHACELEGCELLAEMRRSLGALRKMNRVAPDIPMRAGATEEGPSNLVRLVERFRAGEANMGEIFQFLAHGLIARHILRADRGFLSYLQRQSRHEAAQRRHMPTLPA